jgi:cytochrome c
MIRIALLASLLAACGGSSKPAAAPPPAAPEPAAAEAPPAEPAPTAGTADPANDAIAQAALAEQYDAGKKLYVDKKCASCHGDHGEGNPKNPAVIGPNAFSEQPPKGAKLRTMPFKTAADVLAFVQAKMPIKQPGTLTADEAAAVTSWMLSESKVNITHKLDATNAASIPLR